MRKSPRFVLLVCARPSGFIRSLPRGSVLRDRLIKRGHDARIGFDAFGGGVLLDMTVYGKQCLRRRRFLESRKRGEIVLILVGRHGSKEIVSSRFALQKRPQAVMERRLPNFAIIE